MIKHQNKGLYYWKSLREHVQTRTFINFGVAQKAQHLVVMRTRSSKSGCVRSRVRNWVDISIFSEGHFKCWVTDLCATYAQWQRIAPEIACWTDRIARGQSSSILWHYLRNDRITFSRFHGLFVHKATTPPDKLVISLLGCRPHWQKLLFHGR